MTKPDEIGLIVQLILVNCVPWTLGTLQPNLGKHLLVQCGAPVLASLKKITLFIGLKPTKYEKISLQTFDRFLYCEGGKT